MWTLRYRGSPTSGRGPSPSSFRKLGSVANAEQDRTGAASDSREVLIDRLCLSTQPCRMDGPGDFRSLQADATRWAGRRVHTIEQAY